MTIPKHTEYETATSDMAKAQAALSIARRKSNPDAAWDWAITAANHAAAAGVANPRSGLGEDTYPDLRKLDAALRQVRTSEIIIVTRHKGFVEWLERQGITGRVIDRATPADVMGKDVIGNLPWQLAAIAASFSRVAIPGCPPDRRQDELTAVELDRYGAFLRTYEVREVQAIKP